MYKKSLNKTATYTGILSISAIFSFLKFTYFIHLHKLQKGQQTTQNQYFTLKNNSITKFNKKK